MTTTRPAIRSTTIAMKFLSRPVALALALGAWRLRIEYMREASKAARSAIVDGILRVEGEAARPGPCSNCEGRGEELSFEDRYCHRDGHYTVDRWFTCSRCKGSGRAMVAPFDRVWFEANAAGGELERSFNRLNDALRASAEEISTREENLCG